MLELKLPLEGKQISEYLLNRHTLGENATPELIETGKTFESTTIYTNIVYD